nr:MAG TPA: putative sugar ABC transporter, sugar binding protein [Caudoviricetes sp.]
MIGGLSHTMSSIRRRLFLSIGTYRERLRITACSTSSSASEEPAKPTVF